MNHNQKTLLKDGIVIPIIIAVLIVVVFIVAIFNTNGLPFKNNTVNLAQYQSAEITEINSDFSTQGTIKKSEISDIEDNTIIGEVVVSDSSFPLIYNANDVNAVGKFNLNKNKALIGETGSAFAEIYKTDSSKLRMLSKGDVITIDTFYSTYEYKIVDTLTVTSQSELFKSGDGVGHAVVFYTDASIDAGISNEYYVCVGKMISGNEIAN